MQNFSVGYDVLFTPQPLIALSFRESNISSLKVAETSEHDLEGEGEAGVGAFSKNVFKHKFVNLVKLQFLFQNY